MLKLSLIIFLGLTLSGCGNGFAVSPKVTSSYLGSPEEYCRLPSNFAGLPSIESIPTFDQLATIRSTATTLAGQNQLQEAIWLLQDDPASSGTVLSLKQQLLAMMSSDAFQTADGSSLGGAFEKYILTFSNGMKAIFKPTNDVYAEVVGYRLDDLLQLGLVPLTLDRTINGRRGTVQYFLTGMSSASAALIASKNFRKMLIFDFLMRNRDRDLNNFLFWSTQSRVVAIDNGASFSLPCGIPNEIKGHLRIEQSLAQRLSALTEQSFSNSLGDVPSSIKKIIWNQIKKVR